MNKYYLIGVITVLGFLVLLIFYPGCGSTTQPEPITTTTTVSAPTTSTTTTTGGATTSSTTTTTTSTTTTLLWARCRGGSNQEQGHDIQQTTDGGYIFCGYSDSNDQDISAATDPDGSGNHGLEDGWVVKTANTGFITWQNSLGGSQDDRGRAVRQTSDGGYIMCGYTESSDEGDVTFNHGSEDVWVVKLTSSGSVDWKKCYGGSQTDKGYGIRQTSDGGYIVAGITESSSEGDVGVNHGNNDVWIIKLSSTGTIEWQKCYGGSGGEQAYEIEQTSDGGYIIAATASTNNNGDVGPTNGGLDYWIVKIDSSGTLTWQKTFGGSNHDYAYGVEQTSDNGYIVNGTTYSSDGDVTGNNGQSDYWIIKLDSSGNVEWKDCYGGTSYDLGFDIQNVSGGYRAVGYSYSNDVDVSGNHGMYDIWTFKTDTSGTLLEQLALGGTLLEYGFKVYPTSDGGYVICGTTGTSSNDGDVSGYKGGTYDIWIIKR